METVRLYDNYQVNLHVDENCNSDDSSMALLTCHTSPVSGIYGCHQNTGRRHLTSTAFQFEILLLRQ